MRWRPICCLGCTVKSFRPTRCSKGFRALLSSVDDLRLDVPAAEPGLWLTTSSSQPAYKGALVVHSSTDGSVPNAPCHAPPPPPPPPRPRCPSALWPYFVFLVPSPKVSFSSRETCAKIHYFLLHRCCPPPNALHLFFGLSL